MTERPSIESVKRASEMLVQLPASLQREPTSISAIAGQLTGTASTHSERPPARARKALAYLEDQALRHLWQELVIAHGAETATYLSFRLVAQDEAFNAPDWLRVKFEANKAACLEAAQDADSERGN